MNLLILEGDGCNSNSNIFRLIVDGMNTTNLTLTNDHSNFPSSIRIIVLAVAMFSLSFITILGNTIVIYALRTNRHLRTVI